MLMNRWEAQEWIKLASYWFNNVKSMYEFYATQKWELPFGQRVRTGSDSYLNI
jgi:hypothetical protein